MNKQNKITIIGIVCAFIIGGIGGYMIADNKAKQPISLDNSNIEKYRLALKRDAFETDDIVYKDGNLITKLYLTDEGTEYLKTQLFDKNYNVTVRLINNNTDEDNNEYLTSEVIKWNVEKPLDIKMLIDSSQIKDKDILSDFNAQLNKMKKGQEHHIQYQIELASVSEPDYLVRWSGMLCPDK